MNILIKEINEKIINHLHDSIRQKPVQGNYLERHQKKIIALLNTLALKPQSTTSRSIQRRTGHIATSPASPWVEQNV